MKSANKVVIRIAATVKKHLKLAGGMHSGAIKAWHLAALEVERVKIDKKLGTGTIKQLAQVLKRDAKTLYAWARVAEVFSKREIGKWLTKDREGALTRSHFIEAAPLKTAEERSAFLGTVIEESKAGVKVMARSARPANSTVAEPTTAPALLELALQDVRTFGDDFKAKMDSTAAEIRRAKEVMAAADATSASQALVAIQAVIYDMGARLTDLSKIVTQEMEAIRTRPEHDPASGAATVAGPMPARDAA